MQTITVPVASLMEIVRLQLETGGKANLAVTGSSMLPMLRQGRDSVILVPAKEGLRVGDIALYEPREGKYVLHRVMKLTPEGYLFCGDNQAVYEPVAREKIIARVDGYVRHGKQHSLSSFGYLLYKFIWVRLFFLRKYYIRLRRRLGRWRRARSGRKVQ